MQPKEIVSRLNESPFRFDAKTTQQKLVLIEELAKAGFKNSEEIIACHDRLLCILAFPDNQKVFDAVNNALKQLGQKTKIFLENASDSEVWKLTESAIAHSVIRSSFSYEMIRWLVENYPDEVSFSGCEAAKEVVGSVFKQILPPAVGEALFDNHEHSLETLAKKVTANTKSLDVLRWTLTQFASSSIPDKSKEQLFEQLCIYVDWQTNAFSPTRTFARANYGKKFFFHSSNLIHHADLRKIFSDKKLHPVALNTAEKKNLCDIAKGVLCSNYREIDPITYAENTDTELYDIGRGITIALYYMRPSWRLSCESYVSYMAFRNGVPVSYGGGWMFFDRTKLAGNVFPAFRGGESAYLFAHLYRLYHLRFGANCFQVAPYQIGQKNEDAITSGAFWFYHRLGFRPNDKKLQALAEEESAKRIADKKYRSPAAVLRKFANTEMILNLSPHIHVSHQEVLVQMQKIVTEKYSGNFADYFELSFSALQKAARQHKLNVATHLQSNLPAMELCGIAAAFSNYSGFSKNDLKKFISAMEEKGFGSEKKFYEIFGSIGKLRKDIYSLTKYKDAIA